LSLLRPTDRLTARSTVRLTACPPVRLLPHCLGINWQHGDLRQLLKRSLGGEVEAPQRGDVIAPPLESSWSSHAEPVHVQNAASDTVLGNLGDRGHHAVSHGLEVSGNVCRGPFVADRERQAQPLQRGRQQSALRRRSGGGYQDPE